MRLGSTRPQTGHGVGTASLDDAMALERGGGRVYLGLRKQLYADQRAQLCNKLTSNESAMP